MVSFPENINVEDAFHILRKWFEKSGIETASLDARVLLSEILDISHVQFISSPNRQIEEKDHAALQTAAQKRMKRQPLSHILGRREFFSRDFIVSPHTLTPRPDSEIVVETALQHLHGLMKKKGDLRILDLGTGTGCLLLTLLAECDGVSGTGVDLSEEALVIAKKNARDLGLHSRCTFLAGDWFEPVEGKFDVVISNPPYIPSSDIEGLQDEVRLYEPRLALDGGSDGLDPYRHIIAKAHDYLNLEGSLILEIGADQYEGVSAIFAEHEQNSGISHVACEKDIAGRNRCVQAIY